MGHSSQTAAQVFSEVMWFLLFFFLSGSLCNNCLFAHPSNEQIANMLQIMSLSHLFQNVLFYEYSTYYLHLISSYLIF